MREEGAVNSQEMIVSIGFTWIPGADWKTRRKQREFIGLWISVAFTYPQKHPF
jgi:hypothetical protein